MLSTPVYAKGIPSAFKFHFNSGVIALELAVDTIDELYIVNEII